jgi:hypothetical protein
MNRIGSEGYKLSARLRKRLRRGTPGEFHNVDRVGDRPEKVNAPLAFMEPGVYIRLTFLNAGPVSGVWGFPDHRKFWLSHGSR